MQTILVSILFLAALLYVGRLIFLNFKSKSVCSTGCGKCGAIDFNKLEKQLKEKGL
jgi:hypothetical protein